LPVRWQNRYLELTFAAVAKFPQKAIAPDLENENQIPGQNVLKRGVMEGGDIMS